MTPDYLFCSIGVSLREGAMLVGPSAGAVGSCMADPVRSGGWGNDVRDCRGVWRVNVFRDSQSIIGLHAATQRGHTPVVTEPFPTSR